MESTATWRQVDEKGRKNPPCARGALLINLGVLHTHTHTHTPQGALTSASRKSLPTGCRGLKAVGTGIRKTQLEGIALLVD